MSEKFVDINIIMYIISSAATCIAVAIAIVFSPSCYIYSDEDRPASSASSRTSLLQQLGRGGASRVLDLEVDLAENDMHSTTRLVKELRNRETQSDENVAKVHVICSSLFECCSH